jgi:hypothetical protein
MILFRFLVGIILSLFCVGVGAFFLNQCFENSGQDVLIVVLVAPVFCASGILLFWATISHYRTFREWQRYRQ